MSLAFLNLCILYYEPTKRTLPVGISCHILNIIMYISPLTVMVSNFYIPLLLYILCIIFFLKNRFFLKEYNISPHKKCKIDFHEKINKEFTHTFNYILLLQRYFHMVTSTIKNLLIHSITNYY